MGRMGGIVDSQSLMAEGKNQTGRAGDWWDNWIIECGKGWAGWGWPGECEE